MRVTGAFASLSIIALMLNAQLGGPAWVSSVLFTLGLAGCILLWGSMVRWGKLERLQDRVEDALRRPVGSDHR